MSEKFGFEKKDRPNFSKILFNLINFHQEKLFPRPNYEMKIHEEKQHTKNNNKVANKSKQNKDKSLTLNFYYYFLYVDFPHEPPSPNHV